MKKFLKIFFITLLVLLVLLLTAPVIFKGKIFDVITEQVNNNVKAQVHIGNLRISFFKQFPDLSIQLEDISVVGVDEFEGDTLVSFNNFVVAVNVISAIKMENIEVKKIILDNPVIHGIILENGLANWDIAYSDTTETAIEDTTSESDFSTVISLKEFAINNANISYIDHESNMAASLSNFNFYLSGDLGQDFTTLQIKSNTNALDYSMDGIQYVKQAPLNMQFNIDANMVENVYILQDNYVEINQLALLFEGSAAMPNDEDITLDMKFSTKQTTFKSILSMVPAVFMNDFKDVETNGEFELGGTIKGTLNENQTPSAYLKLLVNNANFNYPDLPESVEKIAIDLEVNYDGVQNDNTTIDLNKFYLEIAQNPVEMVLNVSKPMSDIQVNGLFKTNMNLAKLANAIPMEDTKVAGEISGAVDFMGRVVDIENEQYEKFKADGSLDVSNITYLSSDLPVGVAITEGRIAFSPKYVKVHQFDLSIGNSDIQIKGNVENFIPYLFDNETIKGELAVTSGLLDANEFLTEEETVEEVAVTEDSAAIEVFEVPDNIDFKLVADLNKVLYDKLEIDNLNGIIWVKDGIAKLENLSMNTLDGTLGLGGTYNTQDIENPMVDFEIDMKEINIPEAFDALVLVQEFIPMARNTSGYLSASFNLTSILEQNMSPRLNSVIADGSFATKNIQVKESGVLTKLGDVLKTDKFSNLAVNDVAGDFEIRNGRIYVDPFDIKMGDTKLTVGGDQGIDQSLNYNLDITMPGSALGKGANELIGGLTEKYAGNTELLNTETINIKADVGGTVKDPKIKPRLAGTKGSAAETVKEEAKAVVEEKVEEVKQEAKETANEQAEKIMAEARKKAEIVKAEAKNAAEKVRKEGYAKADQLVKEANNPIAKKAAEISAQKLRDETDNKADQMIKEGNDKADKIIKEAQIQADKLK